VLPSSSSSSSANGDGRAEEEEEEKEEEARLVRLLQAQRQQYAQWKEQLYPDFNKVG
jgi:F0F1-type ATP synthase membrane subunit b/b'